MKSKNAAWWLGTAVICLLVITCRAAEDGPTSKEEPKKLESPAIVTIGEDANQKVIETVLGREIEVRLIGDRRMTGWCAPDPWPAPPPKKRAPGPKEKQPEPPPVMRYLGPSFEATPDAKDSAIGTYIFKYRAVGTGERTLAFNYIYPDGHGYENMPRLATQLVRQFTVTVRVADAK